MKLPDSNWPEDGSYTVCSSTAWPKPCATPPATWPRTISGLTVLPKSSHTHVAHQLDNTGFRIDLDLGHVAAVRECVGVDRRDLGGIQQRRRLTGRRFLPLGRRQRDDIDAAIGADDGEAALGEGDIGDRGLQFLGGGLLALLDDGFETSAGSPDPRNTGCGRRRCPPPTGMVSVSP